MSWKEVKDFAQLFDIDLEDAETRLRDKIATALYFESKNTKGQQLEIIYFTIISMAFDNINNILEIGTGLGVITDILSILFQDAMIYTIDLPESDKDYQKLAIRKNKDIEFKKNIANKNIKFIEKNSFFLPSLDIPDSYDLIWVDGGHQYPAVAWDIMYSYNHLKPGGFIFMHDYGRKKTDVKNVIDHIQTVIKEKINFLPFAMYDKKSKTCWLQKM